MATVHTTPQISVSLNGVVAAGIICLVGIACNGAPTELTYTSTLDVSYKHVDGAKTIELSLDIHVPDNAQNAPVVLFVHGGSWAFGDKSIGSSSKLPFLIGLGHVVVSTNYRLSSDTVRHPHHVMDVAGAVGWVTENIADYGGDPNAIYLMGHSAGAHLASLIALDERRLEREGVDPRVIRGVVLIDSASLNLVQTMQNLKDTPTSPYHDAFGSNLATWEDASPLHHIDDNSGYPPFLLLVASPVLMPNVNQLKAIRDQKRNEVLAFALELEKADTRVYTVDAMQFKSHRSIDRDMGKKDDSPSALVATFLLQTAAVHRGDRSNVSMNLNTVLTVEGEQWEAAKRELGEHSANVLLYYRDTNDNERIDPFELREDELPFMDDWDLDNDGAISRDDIVNGYEMLPPE